jgi:hypothetical protein
MWLYNGLNEFNLPMQLNDWLLVVVVEVLLIIGLTKISLTKSGFNHPPVIESPLGLRTHAGLVGWNETRPCFDLFEAGSWNISEKIAEK